MVLTTFSGSAFFSKVRLGIFSIHIGSKVLEHKSTDKMFRINKKEDL